MKWLYNLILLLLTLCFGPLCERTAIAENIDPANDGSHYALGENIGWLNLEPNGEGGPGVTVGEALLSGYIWRENAG